MPAEATVRLWSKQEAHPFAAQYEKSRLIGYGAMAEELIEIADDGSNDWIERHDKENVGYQANGEHIQRSRLRVDTRKWILSKMLPKVYGDKIAVGGAEDLPPIQVDDAELARGIAFVLQSAAR
ncbi:MAG TPA: hypothetical protein PK593_04110 [Thermomicrobiales bacterium]|nr:hypothetical protein [Thermomicrobiales bacterium]